MLNLRKSLLAVACMAACAGPAAAVTITEAFDGAWVDESAVGTNKGLLVDYIPSANIVFFAFFTYDEDGNPIWVTHNFSLDGSNSDYTGDILYFTGGAFSAGGNPAQEVIGSYDISFACGNIQLDFEPTAESGLQPVSFDMVQVADSMSGGECVDSIAECPTGTTAQGDACVLPAQISNTLNLPAGKDYIISERVTVQDGGVLNIDAGVRLVGSEDTSTANYIYVARGGKIFANGSPNLPIVFTGPEPVPGSWAGLVLAGNSTCNDETETEECQFEADLQGDVFYGGDNLEDSSGSLRYVQIRWAGQEISTDAELNSLTLLGVGSGTVLDHVQVDGGLDDGFEMFGGSVNGRYLVCSNMGDDCFDFDQGYSGKIQFALGWQGANPDQDGDSNGIESDNDSSNNDKQPRTLPIISNMTLVGGDIGRNGARIRRGSGGLYYNTVLTGYVQHCLNLDDGGTFALADASGPGDELGFFHSHIGTCDAGAFDEADAPYSVAGFFNGGPSNTTGDPQLTNYLPTANSPLRTGGQAPDDSFFVPAMYKGAFAGPNDDWTAGWTVNLP